MGILSAIRNHFASRQAKLAQAEAWRNQLADQAIAKHFKRHGISATYDGVRNSDEYKNYWANADQFDADSAHSRDVRIAASIRARYEIGSNGYADGIAQTYATDLIGNAPSLRMQTSSTGFNQMVENTWHFWCKAVEFRRKLWTMAHAKHSDGEGMAVLRRNPRVNHPIPLDLVLYEAEQFSTPYLSLGETGYIDGIKFDQFGNPLWYDLLTEHPGASSSSAFGATTFGADTERIPAEHVLHWFKMRRPGQHRGVSEMVSTLNIGASFRRMREAVLSANEVAAELNVFLTTSMPPDSAAMLAQPFSTQEITRRMMTALPMGWEAQHMDSKHPNTQYAEFHKTLINEMARGKNMPYNKAACDSSSYNYASGRLDHQTYYGALDVEREDCNDLVLDPLFDVWFDLAIAKFGWLGGDPRAVSVMAKAHLWDWPKHQVADIKAEAAANETKLVTGQIFLHRLYSDAGLDLTDEIAAASQALGVGEDVIRQRLLDITLPVAPQPGAAPSSRNAASDAEDAAEEAIDQLKQRAMSLALQGAPNGN